jgi:DNA-binding helix-hairpin-helix protein with protein kinase domain
MWACSAVSGRLRANLRKSPGVIADLLLCNYSSQHEWLTATTDFPCCEKLRTVEHSLGATTIVGTLVLEKTGIVAAAEFASLKESGLLR